MKVDPKEMNQVVEEIEEEIGGEFSGLNGSGDPSESGSDDYYFEIDPEVLVDEGLKELFDWLKEKRGVKISERKRRVTAECYSLTIQDILKKKKLRPWQGSLIMTAVIGVDIMRQSRTNKPAGKSNSGGQVDDKN